MLLNCPANKLHPKDTLDDTGEVVQTVVYDPSTKSIFVTTVDEREFELGYDEKVMIRTL